MASTHFASAHFASVHFLSNHFSGGTEQVVSVVLPEDAGAGGFEDILIRVPNGHIVAIAAACLMICDDDLD